MRKARTKARSKALEILFEANQRNIDPVILYKERFTDCNIANMPNKYALDVIKGVAYNIDNIDNIIKSSSKKWSIDRMSVIDLIILRIGIWEIVLNAETPNKVVLSESVYLANRFSGLKSVKFINGILGYVATKKNILTIESL